MYFAQLTKNIGTVSNPVRETTYWSFESLQQRNSAVVNIPDCYEDLKLNIPKDKVIRKFSHFTETFSGLFLILN